jgi:hypothetical protein
MEFGLLTVQGFPSTFCDWTGEEIAHPLEVIEAALACNLTDKAKAAIDGVISETSAPHSGLV